MSFSDIAIPFRGSRKSLQAIVSVLLLLLVTRNSNALTNDDIYLCHQFDSQKDISIEQMLGKWYIVEIVQHREDTTLPKGVSVVDTCPVVNLSTRGDRFYGSSYPPTNMRLTWWEDAGDVTYNFYIYDEQPGHWISAGAQNGSLITERQYKQFAGKVYVTKAVRSHAVLTFCSTGTDLYSIVMSRTKRLRRSDLAGVNDLLARKGLDKYAVRETCRGGASTTYLSASAAVLVMLLWQGIGCVQYSNVT